MTPKKKKKNVQHVTRHPWDEWFTFDEFILHLGEDFVCAPRSMDIQTRAAAIKRGLRVSILTSDKGDLHVRVKHPKKAKRKRRKKARRKANA